MGRSGLKRANGKAFLEDSRSNRTGSKGSGAQKPKEKPKASSKSHSKSEAAETESQIPLELQQLLLNIFKDVFHDVLEGEDLKKTLQEIKGALYERDFEKAFGSNKFLESYAVRWSPSRALCYQAILVDIYDHLRDLLPREKQVKKSLEVVCFGGGAAEIIAVAGFLRYLQDTSPPKPVQENGTTTTPLTSTESTSEEAISQTLQETSISTPTTVPLLNLTLLDIANWDSVVQKLQQGVITAPSLPSTSSTTTSAPFLSPGDLTTTFSTSDVLNLSQEQAFSYYGEEPRLITLLFTLNELYTASISKTTAFLLKLTMAVSKGTLLLVVDSPGSYSEAKVGSGGGEGKKYPMKWLMDHALLDRKKIKGSEQENEREKEEEARWEKILEDDSRWFRLAESLRYPIPLENMRYQIHLYRRL